MNQEWFLELIKKLQHLRNYKSHVKPIYENINRLYLHNRR